MKNNALWLGLVLAAAILFSGEAQARDFNAGPIWSNSDAKRKCPRVCAAHRYKWNGQWRTTIRGKMSVCGCR
ncbi:MAG: mannan-binding lectin [Myxococcales bacterium]|nr:mannan-binding lectin [Myxococcales bacterium]MCB9643261.1 mannan-binding lectin [Myxococcales bacterium]